MSTSQNRHKHQFRFRFSILGGHTHVRVFAGLNGKGMTLGKCGDLTFRNEEWEEFVNLIHRATPYGSNQAEILPE